MRRRRVGAPDAVGASRWLRLNLWLHRWCGLVATLPFLILCLSGTVLIFHDEIDAALGTVPEAHGADRAPRLPLARSVDSVLAAFPGERVLSIGLDPQAHPGVALLVTAPADERGFDHYRMRYTRLADARPVTDAATRQTGTLTGFLLELHAHWFLGLPGELLGALIALLVLIALLSGVVVYWPHVKKVAFGRLRRGRGPRLRQLDLHNTLGVVVMGWALTVGLSGFLLGFGTLAQSVWQRTELVALQRRHAGPAVDRLRPPVDVDRAQAAALAAMPRGWHAISIVFPQTDFSTDRHYTVLVAGQGLDQRLFRVVLVDAASGQVPAVVELPGYLKAIALAQPLHFGDYGGLPLKLLWTLCAWLTLFVTANGAWLWWDRRRRHRRAPATPAGTGSLRAAGVRAGRP
ncbi:PepSY-associated TM helix domain-containing protein [Xanthomonas sp. CFBP 8445]|uniref:PepSY-associated TM helix domain-containing protein n=1 Tax=Xanthomonas sp. CFBP 8445 TaxID=2971236 RepID=UPI0021DF4790|nr:PepSY-associated TM helix domain-containing protein [Xanthomonas sp. CFBP 8445]UYC10637.1 PepSY domain-containing protein [Xanthomonas sp. CFBP 8445]